MQGHAYTSGESHMYVHFQLGHGIAANVRLAKWHGADKEGLYVESIYISLYPSTREHLAAEFTLKVFALFLTDIPLEMKYQRVFGHKFATMWTRHLKLNRSTPSFCEMTLQRHKPVVAYRALFSGFLPLLTREAWFAEIAVATQSTPVPDPYSTLALRVLLFALGEMAVEFSLVAEPGFAASAV